MNRKGQALVEFVLILPVFLLILMAIVDFGNIFSSKNELQNQSIDIVRMIQNEEELDEIYSVYSDVDIKLENYKDDYRKIIIIDEVDIVTPFLNKILGDPFQIKVERVIPNA